MTARVEPTEFEVWEPKAAHYRTARIRRLKDGYEIRCYNGAGDNKALPVPQIIRVKNDAIVKAKTFVECGLVCMEEDTKG
jgi:hypothetical protein